MNDLDRVFLAWLQASQDAYDAWTKVRQQADAKLLKVAYAAKDRRTALMADLQRELLARNHTSLTQYARRRLGL